MLDTETRAAQVWRDNRWVMWFLMTAVTANIYLKVFTSWHKYDRMGQFMVTFGPSDARVPVEDHARLEKWQADAHGTARSFRIYVADDVRKCVRSLIFLGAPDWFQGQ